MTLNPECATLDTTILDALHIMHDGKFLHLPVLDRGKYLAIIRRFIGTVLLNQMFDCLPLCRWMHCCLCGCSANYSCGTFHGNKLMLSLYAVHVWVIYDCNSWLILLNRYLLRLTLPNWHIVCLERFLLLFCVDKGIEMFVMLLLLVFFLFMWLCSLNVFFYVCIVWSMHLASLIFIFDYNFKFHLLFSSFL